MYNKLAIM